MSDKKREYIYFTLNERRKELLTKASNIELMKGLDNNAILEKLLDMFITNPAAFNDEQDQYNDIDEVINLLNLYGKTIYEILQKFEEFEKRFIDLEVKINSSLQEKIMKKGIDLFEDIDKEP